MDEYTRPAVEGDGGAIEFDSFSEGIVKVVLKGACSGCPSSTLTLKSGIESLLIQKMGEKVKEVRESKRLKDSPAVLVNPDNSMSGSMQKIMQIMNKDQSIPEKIMEVNKNHPLMRNLLKIFKAGIIKSGNYQKLLQFLGLFVYFPQRFPDISLRIIKS